VDDLEKSGSICQAGLIGKRTGRRAMLYAINVDFGCLIVLYYKWGSFVGRVTDIAGKTLYEKTYVLKKDSHSAALQCTFAAIDDLSANAPNAIKAIGIGVPGAVLPDRRLMGIPKIAAWEGFNLVEALESRYSADIVVENDVRLSAVGYYRRFLIDRFDNIIYIYAGNGMGAGIIINKLLYRGSTNFSGELGYMAPLTGSPPERDYTSTGGYLETRLSEFVNIERGEFWAKDDPEHRKVLVNMLGAAAANQVVLLNPDVVVFGGEAFDAEMTREIRNHMTYYTPRNNARDHLRQQRRYRA
jgi:predicted NBD/HSP70 family sugar kinase